MRFTGSKCIHKYSDVLNEHEIKQRDRTIYETHIKERNLKGKRYDMNKKDTKSLFCFVFIIYFVVFVLSCQFYWNCVQVH